MHRFLRAAGFSMYQKKKDIRALLRCLAREAGTSSCLQLDRETELYEIKTEVAPGIGVAMYGELNEQDEMEIEYYYRYILNEEVTSRAECSIQRHTEKETYAGLLDEYKVGLSLIFYLLNPIEYRECYRKERERLQVTSVSLAGFANRGKVLLPIKKTALQIEKAKVAAKNRDELLEAAKNGVFNNRGSGSLFDGIAPGDERGYLFDRRYNFYAKRDRVRSVFDFRRDQRGYM